MFEKSLARLSPIAYEFKAETSQIKCEQFSHSNLFPFVSGNCVVINAASRYPAAHR